MTEKSYLMSLLRDENHKIQRLFSHRTDFKSERDRTRQIEALISMNLDPDGVGTYWEDRRIMRKVPLASSRDILKRVKSTKDFRFLPKELKYILQKDLLRTASHGANNSIYSVLMPSTKSGLYPEGRTGVLLQNNEPVIVTIDGRDFLVEIKGVGSPDGNNRKKEPMIREGFCGDSMERYGGLSESKAQREFDNLELMRDTQTFEDGDCPRAAGLITFLNDVEYGEQGQRQDQGYLIRLTPSNVRASFNTNPAFPKPDHMKLVESVARHYVEMMKKGLYHVCIHPENILFTGSRYVLTDLADVRSMDEVEDGDKLLRQVLPTIDEVPGITEVAVKHFYEIIKQELDAVVKD